MWLVRLLFRRSIETGGALHSPFRTLRAYLQISIPLAIFQSTRAKTCENMLFRCLHGTERMSNNGRTIYTCFVYAVQKSFSSSTACCSTDCTLLYCLLRTWYCLQIESNMNPEKASLPFCAVFVRLLLIAVDSGPWFTNDSWSLIIHPWWVGEDLELCVGSSVAMLALEQSSPSCIDRPRFSLIVQSSQAPMNTALEARPAMQARCTSILQSFREQGPPYTTKDSSLFWSRTRV